MSHMLTLTPEINVLLGVLALIGAVVLARFLIRQVLTMVKIALVLCLLAGAAARTWFILVRSAVCRLSLPTRATRRPIPKHEQTAERQIFAQIVDSEDKDRFVERAILERRPYNRLLKTASKSTAEQLRKAINDRTFPESLSDEPDLHRGEPYFAGRGVVLEISDLADGQEYGLPKGTMILPRRFHQHGARRVRAAHRLPPGIDAARPAQEKHRRRPVAGADVLGAVL